jgi:NADH:ubiquinone oxidoreductase subunit E
MGKEEVEIREKTRTILQDLEDQERSLIPVLQRIQAAFGYLSLFPKLMSTA